jgi:UDP-N-acetylmuramoyl-L-alanyl-D-glutamate--2,6-diaminopimelate ligase
MATGLGLDAVAGRIPSRLLLAVETSGLALDVAEVMVSDVHHDSREVTSGSLFACLVGARHDGHDHAAEAVDRGAVALLVERPLELEVPQLVVTDTREAMAHIAVAVHGDPATKLLMVGITGTNGKTTVTQLLGQVLSAAGHDVEVFGTLSGPRTTPEASDLQRGLARSVVDGRTAVVMEVSSHALVLDRVTGVRFDLAVFTNLGRDHLDLHDTTEEYFRAKARLFSTDFCERALVNADDIHGRLLIDGAEVPTQAYALAEATEVELGVTSLSFSWRGHQVSLPMGGAVNVHNALAVLDSAVLLGVDESSAVAALGRCAPVPGRFEPVTSSDPTAPLVVVDYAHTPEALERLIQGAREAAPTARCTVVIGCGGERDREKRPEMGRAALAADRAVLTSDNPRGERPEKILSDMLSGMSEAERGTVLVEVDREAAIRRAIVEAGAGEIVLIAGKGHETTQEGADGLRHFDDREIARAALGVDR